MTPKTPDIITFATKLLGLKLSPMQATILASAYGLPPGAGQLELFQQGTGLPADKWPSTPISTLVVIAGRGSGKDSRIATVITLYEALFGHHEPAVIGDQPATCVLVSQNERAVKHVTFRYLRDYVKRSPLIASQVTDLLSTEMRVKTGVSIECLPSTADAARGYHMPCAVLNEVGTWRLEGKADSDVEILASVQPRAEKVVILGTPYLMNGVLWDYAQRFGQDIPGLLVWKVPTALMVPSLAAKIDKRRRLMDPERARREFDADFISGVGEFLPLQMVEACVAPGMFERDPGPTSDDRTAALDLSGGRKDQSALAIVHTEGDMVVHDLLRVWGNSTARESLVAEAAAHLRRYGLRRVYGDNFGANWVVEAFARHQVTYVSTSALKGRLRLTRSDAYVEVEPLIRAGRRRISLLDLHELVREFANLIRKDRPGGKYTVDHVSGEHDDRANAVSLAAVIANRARVRRTRRFERPDGVDFGRSDSAESLEVLLQWARECKVPLDDGIARRLDHGDKLTPREADSLRRNLAERKFELEHPLQARLLRAGIEIEEDDGDEDDYDDDGDTSLDYSDVLGATLGGLSRF